MNRARHLIGFSGLLLGTALAGCLPSESFSTQLTTSMHRP